MAKEIFFSDEARSGLFKGVTKLADAVKLQWDLEGRNVLSRSLMGATFQSTKKEWELILGLAKEEEFGTFPKD